MKLVVQNPVPVAETPKDSYVVEIQSMQGDGDGYRDFTVGPFKKGQDEASLQSLLETLKRMDERFPNGRTGDGTYRDVLGFQQWFGTDIVSIEHFQEFYPQLLTEHGIAVHEELIQLAEHHFSEWHGDAMTDYKRDEKLSKYEVFYYDGAGMKHTVDISWEA
jgi:hypothetical protein